MEGEGTTIEMTVVLTVSCICLNMDESLSFCTGRAYIGLVGIFFYTICPGCAPPLTDLSHRALPGSRVSSNVSDSLRFLVAFGEQTGRGWVESASWWLFCTLEVVMDPLSP